MKFSAGILALCWIDVRGARFKRKSMGDSTDSPSVLKPMSHLTWNQPCSSESHVGGNAKAARCDGKLVVPLAPEDGSQSPKLTVWVRMRIAPEQPAPLGLLVVHCGGPGSERNCLDWLVPFSEQNERLADKYNIVAIDQRGIGESEPRLSCSNPKRSLPPLGSMTLSMSNFSDCPCEMADHSNFITTDTKWDSVLDGYQAKANSLRECYASSHLQLDGYNVMDYLGTSYLAHDLNLLRQAVGAEKLSLYGISYGTWVAAVYASQYPEFTDKVIVDSNLPPAPDLNAFSADYASNEQMMVAEWARRCRKLKCFSDVHPETAFNQAIAKLESGIFKVPTDVGHITLSHTTLTGIMHGMLRDYSHTLKTSEEDADIDLDLLPDHITLSVRPFVRFARQVDDLRKINTTADAEAYVQSFLSFRCRVQDLPVEMLNQCVDKEGTNLGEHWGGNTFSCPTWKQYGKCFSSSHPRMTQQNLMYIGVMAADVPSRYLPSQMLTLTKRLYSDYGAIGGFAAHIMEDLALWPGKATYAGIGSGKVAPLIVGVLDDSATAFKWTQQQKLAFPMSSLMSWQGYHHGMPSPFSMRGDAGLGIYDCYKAMEEYLETGVLPRNGMTCHAEE